jgi:hypothetical protein
MPNRDTKEQVDQPTCYPVAENPDPTDKDKPELTKETIEKNRFWARSKTRPKKYTGS